MKKQLPTFCSSVLMTVSALALCCFLSSCPPKRVAFEPYEGEVVQTEAEVFEVEIVVTQTSSYCGGAAPPDELLQQLATPQPLSGKKLHIKKGNTNDASMAPIMSVNTDTNGMVKLQLDAGSYCIVFDNKVDSAYYKMLLSNHQTETESYLAADKKCLDKWLMTPEYSFIVQSDAINVYTFNYHNACSWDSMPCMGYKGPYPP